MKKHTQRRARAFLILLGALFACVSCSTHKPFPNPGNPDHYYAFVTFARSLVADVAAHKYCPPEAARINYANLQHELDYFIDNSAGANWRLRYETLQNALWIWLGRLRDLGYLPTEEYARYARSLARWSV